MSGVLNSLDVFEKVAVVQFRGVDPDCAPDDEARFSRACEWLAYEHGWYEQSSKTTVGIISINPYNDPPGEFSVLVTSTEVDDLIKLATAHGYSHLCTDEITEPQFYGHELSEVVIMKHPDGWAVAPKIS